LGLETGWLSGKGFGVGYGSTKGAPWGVGAASVVGAIPVFWVCQPGCRGSSAGIRVGKIGC
ncbi:hypothetical protein ACFL5O_12040, partial [Myxococcota bacterium]